MKTTILLKTSRHPHHDLADMAAAFHQPVRFRDLIQREDPVDDRCQLTAFNEWPDLCDEVVADGAFFVGRAGAHGGPSDGEAFDLMGVRLTFSATAPPRNAMMDRQPSLASAERFFSK